MGQSPCVPSLRISFSLDDVSMERVTEKGREGGERKRRGGGRKRRDWGREEKKNARETNRSKTPPSSFVPPFRVEQPRAFAALVRRKKKKR